MGDAILALLALAGIGQAATAFVFLFISERTPLFGFMEPGYDPTAILTARIAEAATVVFLGAFMWARFLRRTPTSSRGFRVRSGIVPDDRAALSADTR
jgi:hypothetical protein